MRAMLAIVLTVAVTMLAAWPVAADSGELPESAEYGQHVREHVQEMGGFTGEMNPGVHHRGKSGWDEHHDDDHSH